MKQGDQAFLYHSSCEMPGIAGIVQWCARPIPTRAPSTAAIRTTIPSSDRANPRWYHAWT